MKKILIVEGRASVGGGQIMTSKISKVLSENFIVEILCPSNYNQDFKNLFDQYKIHGFKHIEQSRGKKNFLDYLLLPLNILFSIVYTAKLLIKEKYDLIYIQHPTMLPVIAMLSFIIKMKVIMHVHVVHTDLKVRKFMNFFISFKSINHIIGVSKYSLSQFTSIQKRNKKSSIIYNCIEGFEYIDSRKPADYYHIAVVADVIKDKGQDVILNALELIPNNKCYLHIVGPIIDENYYSELISKKYNFKYTFEGRLTNINEFLNTIDLLVVPSRSLFETFSLSMVEAWCKGIPTIASNIGGMAELVNTFFPQYKNLLLFENENISDFAGKIKLLSTCDEIKLREIKNELLSNANTLFSFEKFAVSLNQVIQENI